MEPTIPDPSAVESWPQAVVFCCLILAVMVVPAVMTYLTGRGQKAHRAETEKLRETLTTNNGGSHLKDQFDRIEFYNLELTKSQKALNKKFDDHIAWSDNYVRQTDKRIHELETPNDPDVAIG